MPDFESLISTQLHRQADALSIDEGLPDRIASRVRMHQRRLRVALVGAPLVMLAAMTLAAAVVIPSRFGRAHPPELAVPTTLFASSAPVSPSPSSYSPSFALNRPVLEPFNASQVRWLDFVSPTRGWALAEVDGQLRVGRTIDAGLTWAVVGSPLPRRPSSEMPTRLVAVLGGNGIGSNVAELYAFRRGASELFVSWDRAASWQVVEFPGPVLGVAPPPGLAAFPLGPSVNDGELWALIDSPSKGSRTGQVELAVSSDFGRTWRQSAAIPGASEGSSLIRASQGRGYVLSRSALGGHLGSSLVQTTDGGASWKQLADPCANLPYQRLGAASAEALWLVCGGVPAGDRQAKSIYFSPNAGRTWRHVASVDLSQRASAGSLGGLGYLVDVTAVSNQDLCVTLGGGPVEMTTDGGHTWRPAFTLPGGTRGAEQVTFVDATHGWALTSRGIWHATEGLHWKYMDG